MKIMEGVNVKMRAGGEWSGRRKIKQLVLVVLGENGGKQSSGRYPSREQTDAAMMKPAPALLRAVLLHLQSIEKMNGALQATRKREKV
mmetsp:Transcript_4761/g.11700  ORF Transcript_4761/g.11700 Transcript_4761/m.11700 type:complete len:88 (-) Transcript_4761:1502-1765(-)